MRPISQLPCKHMVGRLYFADCWKVSMHLVAYFRERAELNISIFYSIRLLRKMQTPIQLGWLVCELPVPFHLAKVLGDKRD